MTYGLIESFPYHPCVHQISYRVTLYPKHLFLSISNIPPNLFLLASLSLPAAFLDVYNMNIPLQYLWLIPFIAGTSWLLTLSTLFIIWIAKNRPRYPSQVNPYVAYFPPLRHNYTFLTIPQFHIRHRRLRTKAHLHNWRYSNRHLLHRHHHLRSFRPLLAQDL